MSCIVKINQSGLTIDQKNRLKFKIQNNPQLGIYIAEDDAINDDLLSGYLNDESK